MLGLVDRCSFEARWSREVTRWFRWGLSVADPFGCRCLTSRTLHRFHLPLIEPDWRISHARQHLRRNLRALLHAQVVTTNDHIDRIADRAEVGLEVRQVSLGHTVEELGRPLRVACQQHQGHVIPLDELADLEQFAAGQTDDRPVRLRPEITLHHVTVAWGGGKSLGASLPLIGFPVSFAERCVGVELDAMGFISGKAVVGSGQASASPRCPPF
jgi:hypothetical protein